MVKRGREIKGQKILHSEALNTAQVSLYYYYSLFLICHHLCFL